MKTQPTQRTLIIKRLKAGWCTGLDAVFSTGSMKLATRVSELRRAGVAIADKWVEVGGKRVKAYRISKGC
jgi:hypothetical protein